MTSNADMRENNVNKIASIITNLAQKYVDLANELLMHKTAE